MKSIFRRPSQLRWGASSSLIPQEEILAFCAYYECFLGMRAKLLSIAEHCPLRYRVIQYEFIKMGMGALIEEPRPMSLDLQKAEYEGFPMRYITFL